MRVAFFDMDKTLVRVNTARLYARWRYDRGESKLLDVARVSWWSLQYTLGWVDAHAVSRYVASTMTGRDEAAFQLECNEWFLAMVRRHVTDAARRAVDARRADGMLPVILTGSSRYAAVPLAAELGIEHVISSMLMVHEGRFTGEVDLPLCFGEGKVERALRFCVEHRVDLERSAFYTDSASDIPMLERVGEPRVVNPDPRLSRVAAQRGWPVEYWR